MTDILLHRAGFYNVRYKWLFGLVVLYFSMGYIAGPTELLKQIPTSNIFQQSVKEVTEL